MGIRLLIADDHEVVRIGLRSLLADRDIEIVAEASGGAEAVELVERHRPDVVLMDVRMPNDEGLAALKTIKQRWPEMPVVMLSNYDNPTYVARAMSRGASGYLLKGASGEELIAALETVATGETVWTAGEIRRFTGALRAAKFDSPVEVTLTNRESEVLHQMAYGLTNKEIADSLKISYETVKEHVQHILRKLGVTDRTQAAVWAVRNKLV